MPIVRIELYSGRTAEQKTNCAREIVDAVSRTLGVPAEATQVVFQDVERSDWLTGGKIPPPAAKKE
jgi:4-oxalocrotonate tautomerase